LGGFLEPTGPGAGVRGVFSADGVLLVRWASANFDFFRGFFAFFDRFLPVFVPNFALFPSMPCAYLYVNNYFSVSLARELHSLQRSGPRPEPHPGQGGRSPLAGQARRGLTAAREGAAGHGRGRSPAREHAEDGGDRGKGGGKRHGLQPRRAGAENAEGDSGNRDLGTRPLDHALRQAQGREHGRTARAALRFSKGGNRKRGGKRQAGRAGVAGCHPDRSGGVSPWSLSFAVCRLPACPP